MKNENLLSSMKSQSINSVFSSAWTSILLILRTDSGLNYTVGFLGSPEMDIQFVVHPAGKMLLSSKNNSLLIHVMDEDELVR